jgi:hypothetical protein
MWKVGSRASFTHCAVIEHVFEKAKKFGARDFIKSIIINNIKISKKKQKNVPNVPFSRGFAMCSLQKEAIQTAGAWRAYLADSVFDGRLQGHAGAVHPGAASGGGCGHLEEKTCLPAPK